MIAPWIWRECMRAWVRVPWQWRVRLSCQFWSARYRLRIMTTFLRLIPPVSLAAWALALAIFSVTWCVSGWFGALSTNDRLYLREAMTKLRFSRLVLLGQPARTKSPRWPQRRQRGLGSEAVRATLVNNGQIRQFLASRPISRAPEPRPRPVRKVILLLAILAVIDPIFNQLSTAYGLPSVR